MECPVIEGLVFDEDSRKGIARIRRIHELSDVLIASMGAGVFVNIFAGNSVPEATYNIYSMDWRLFAKSVGGIPAITQRAIRTEALNQYWLHRDKPNQRYFWKAVAEGCRGY